MPVVCLRHRGKEQGLVATTQCKPGVIHHLLAVWLRTGYLISLCLSFLISQRRIMMASMIQYYREEKNELMHMEHLEQRLSHRKGSVMLAVLHLLVCFHNNPSCDHD